MPERATVEQLLRLADAKGEEMTRILPTFMAQVAIPNWRDLPMRHFHLFVGATYIVEIAPGVNRIVLAQLDFGLMKYDPAASTLQHELAFLVEMKK